MHTPPPPSACLPCPACPQHIRDITDPEHPYTLEQLNVVAEEQVEVDDSAGTVKARALCRRLPCPAVCMSQRALSAMGGGRRGVCALTGTRYTHAAAAAGALHTHGGALQHGDPDWAVHTGQAAARAAAAVQGGCRGGCSPPVRCSLVNCQGDVCLGLRVPCKPDSSGGWPTCNHSATASGSHPPLPSLPPCLPTCLPAPLPWQADILLTAGSHASEAAVNKQLGDKERVAAALENPNLLQMVDRCLGSSL